MGKNLLFIIASLAIFGSNHKLAAQCADGYVFDFNGKSYEIVSQNKTWAAAAACAVAKGGYLVEINNAAEQAAVFSAITNLNINPANTASSDGFSSYLWLGGNDIANEGNWVWNGDNNAVTTPFWIGTASGTLVAGQYSNWGFEPDNWSGAGPAGQDALGISIINWQNGVAGEWNDISHNNSLYYVIEYNSLLDLTTVDKNTSVGIYPNPVQDNIFLYNNSGLKIEKIVFVNSIGQEIKIFQAENAITQNYDVSNFQAGVYFLQLHFEDGAILTKKIVKK